jgi:hypothetical protein
MIVICVILDERTSDQMERDSGWMLLCDAPRYSA